MTTIASAIDASAAAVAVGTKHPPRLSEAENQTQNSVPAKYEGYLLKKKKWPLKGWHRRYFLLENGFLKYAKRPNSITKNKLHGLMDMGLSVMSTKKNCLTIDLDAEDIIFHLKVKSSGLYQLWTSKLRLHRDYRLFELNKDATLTHRTQSISDGLTSPVLSPACHDKDFPRDFERNMDTCTQSLKQAQQDVSLLQQMVLELQQAGDTLTTALLTMPPSPSPSLSKKDKERKSKKSSKKASKSNSTATTNNSSTLSNAAGSTPNFLVTDGFKIPTPLEDRRNLSKSNPDLNLVTKPSVLKPSSIGEDFNKQPVQFSKSVHSTPVHPRAQRTSALSESSAGSAFSTTFADFTEKQRNFIVKANSLQKSLSSALDDLKNLDEAKQSQPKIAAMKNVITQLNHENSDLRSRLQRINAESSLSEPSFSTGTNPFMKRLTSKTLVNQYLSESQLSISESMSEMFYDAEEYLLSDEESTSSEDESEAGDDDISSDAELSDESETMSSKSLPYDVEVIDLHSTSESGRRTKLPCYKADTDVSLWNILKKNIGKDLSKVAMPVTLNEPLNALQLLCEELEYSHLLNRADNCNDIYEQLLYVTAFAISGYGSTYTRAGLKPFNPILGETYECIRDDKSFRFVAEQVSHHPPISVCHGEGEHFEFWQDARFKNKFWGKSMEIFPSGTVHVRLKRHDRHFSWKKVTSCVHNIISGTRWIEHYGDMQIACVDEKVSCKVSFSKSGYWNGKNGEISGSVLDSDGKVRYKLKGKWYEGVTCEHAGEVKVLWKPHSLPSDCEKQYGFTRFAIELNELHPEQVNFLPRSDTRFRPDQRCLENGDISGAEKEKIRVEQLQREHKKQRDAKNIEYKPFFFTKFSGQSDEEGWMFKGDYWKLRQDPGFKNLNLPVLW